MDTWHFYKASNDLWYWRRTAPNGEIVGASTQGYIRKSDCTKNARRNGYQEGDVMPAKKAPKVEEPPKPKLLGAADFDPVEIVRAWPAHTKLEHPVNMIPITEEVVVEGPRGTMEGHPGDWLAYDAVSGHLWVISDEYKQLHYRRT